MYANGRGVAKNDAEAVKWFRKAADQGYAVGQYNLGIMYANGRGVERNDAEAVKWYKKAAEQDNLDAMCNLGLMYEQKRAGFNLNSAGEAMAWYQKAADKGHAGAQYNLAIVLSRSNGTWDLYMAFGYADAAAKQQYPGARQLSRAIWDRWDNALGNNMRDIPGRLDTQLPRRP
jgi:TPR repeat protein